MKTKIDEKHMEKIKRRCSFAYGIDIGAKSFRGGICLALKTEITVCLQNFSKSHIDVLVKEASVDE